MPSSVKQLEEQLKEAGNSLLSPPPYIDELLNLLDRVENLLMNVDQAPNKSMQEALFPSMKALISDELLRHSNMDVKVFVSSCITEITRITAPDAPYNDEQLKEIFQLTLAAFQQLSHISSRCHIKAVSMLDTIAKVKSCLMMLDLECDALVVEMFQHFLKVIGTLHSESVFSAMENIMTMVLDESEEISLNLLNPLLASVQKENQNVSPRSWKLGEMVITKCADKLKPYLKEAVKVTGIAFDDYAPIVVTICQDGSDEPKAVNVSGKNLANENKSAKGTSLNDPPEASENKLAENTIPIEPLEENQNKLAENTVLNELPEDTRATDAPFQTETEQTLNGNRNATSNDSALTRNDENENSSKTLQHCHLKELPKIADPSGSAEPNSSLSVEIEKSKFEPDSVPRKRDSKPNAFMNPMEGYNHYWMSTGRKSPKLAFRRKSHDKGNDSSSEDPASKKATSTSITEVLEPKTKDGSVEVVDSPPMKPKTDEVVADASPSQIYKLPEESHRKRGQSKKKETTRKQEAFSKSPSISREECAQKEKMTPPPLDMSGKKKIQETSTLVGKVKGYSRKHRPASRTDVSHEQAQKPLTMKSTATKGSEERTTETDSSSKDISEGSGIKIISESAKGSSLKSASDKKFKIAKEKPEESEAPELGDQLVGRKVKVFWPMDKMFYEGVVDWYDPIKKKHKILYTDGDEEILYLSKERWELIEDNVLPDEVQMTDLPRHDAPSEISKTRKLKRKSEQAERAKADSSESSPKRKHKRKTVQAEQTKDASSERNGASNDKPVKADAKSANASTFDEPKNKAEPVDERISTNEERNDDGKISPAKSETHESKTSFDSEQNAAETMTSLKKSRLEVIESSGNKCDGKQAENSRGSKKRKYPRASKSEGTSSKQS